MKSLIIISLGMFLGILTTGCDWQHRVGTPDSIKISPSMAWELQEGASTKQKPAISGCIEWKIPK